MGAEFTIDDDGWLDIAQKIQSPNYETRPTDAVINLIVVHGISLPPGEYGGGYIQQFFCNRLDHQAHAYFEQIKDLRVSAHCLVERSGQLIQFVSFDDRAWHAGQSCWQGRHDCNDFSIGIELEGCDDEDYDIIQYQQLARLVIGLRNKYPAISAQSICGHSDIAPGRKTDPGPYFDWNRLKQMIKDYS